MKERITSTESASRSSYETMEANARPRVVCRGAAFPARPTLGIQAGTESALVLALRHSCRHLLRWNPVPPPRKPIRYHAYASYGLVEATAFLRKLD